MGLSATIVLMAASGLLAPAASAAGNVEVFMGLDCTSNQVPVDQSVFCTVQVSHIANPDEGIPTGAVTFSDSRGTGVFSPGNTCTLVRKDAFTSSCGVAFSSATAGGRTIKADYPGDGFNKAGSTSTNLKVFIPNSVRFAAPGGAGAEPCTDKSKPCSLFAAASTRAPGTSIVPGAEVVLATGTYTKADLGGFGELSLESGITFRGEAGAARPLLSMESGVFGANEKISHVEIESKAGSVALSTQGSIVDEVVARSSAAGATTCALDSGVLRDTACISAGAGASAAGSFIFTETGAAFAPKMRNVTAVSTGPESFGLGFQIESLGLTAGELKVDAGSVIAKGTKADVMAKSVPFGGVPLGQVHVTLDHSDYASIEPKDPTAAITITSPGDAGHANITAVPLLAGDNVHETFSSPTIDKGVLDGSNSGSVDVDGEARKQGAAVDIGADEIPPPNNTKTELTCKAPSLFTGESTKCTATVTDNADSAPARSFAGDTVTFEDITQNGAFTPTTCTLATVNSTQASCQTEVELKPTTIANHELKAVFPVDGKGHLGSIGTLTLQVKPLPNTTETKLTCQAPSVFTGGSTKCSATVTDKGDHQPLSSLAGATVSFKDNTESGTFVLPATCVLVTISSTQASCQTEVEFKPTTVITHNLEASYPGDGDKHAPSSGTLSVQVKPLPNTTETELTCKAPSLITGESTKCTATVTDAGDHQLISALAGGTVTFVDHTEDSAFVPPVTCTLVAKGATQATCQTEVEFKPTTVTTHNLEASYPGDGDKHAPSANTLQFEVKLKPNTTVTELKCEAPSLTTGQTTKCTATVNDTADNNKASSLAGGTVNFVDHTEAGTFNPVSCTLVAVNPTQATCQTEVEFKPTTVTTHSLEANYPGDGGKHAPSASTLSFEVKSKPNTTETELKCKASSLITGETTKCTATVTDTADNNKGSSMAGGTVNFEDHTETGTFRPATCTLATVTSTTASCQVEVEFKPIAVAIHTLEAAYAGDGDKHAPSARELPFQVKARAQPNETKTELTCNGPSVISGETTTCTATVTDKENPNPPTSLAGGTVTFKDNTEPAAFTAPATCLLVTINTTQARCELNFKPNTIGDHALEATYPGDGGNHALSKGELTVQVKPKPNDTETKLRCGAPALVVGEATKCTATVTDKANNSPASSLGNGVVNFKDNTEPGSFSPTTCTLAVVTTTTAECQVEVDFKPNLVANHSLEATFAGDSLHRASTGLLTFQVKPKPNNTGTELRCGAPSLITGDTTHCTATVIDKADNGAPTPPSGMVTFVDRTQAGTFTPGSCQLQTSGANVAICQAEVEFRPTTVASHSLEASYLGDGERHLPSSEVVSFQVKPRPNTTETELRCSAPSLITGETTKCTATVTDTADNNKASSMAGTTVTFVDHTQGETFNPPTCTLATISSTQASCQTEVDFEPTAVGSHSLEATYPGDSEKHGPSADPLAFQVKPLPNTTETELTCKAASLIVGESTKCTATVIDNADNDKASPMAGDTVSFKDTSEPGAFTPPATCMLVTKSPTRATCQTEVDFKPITDASHQLEASFLGDQVHAISSDGLEIEVRKPPAHTTKTTLVCDPTTLVLGTGASQCTASVEDMAGSPTHPSGEVKLEIVSGEGTLAAKSCNLPANGQTKVSCQVIAYTPAKAGDQELKASYQSDATHTQSSGVTKLTVTTPPPPPPPPPPPAPNTTLTKKPPKRTAAKLALFKFSSDQPGSTFQCKVDRKAFKACGSPLKVKVRPGAHTFAVKAVNAQGVADPTPVVYKWTVGPVKRRLRR
jgi:Bacterial Ig-like domain (group 3)